MTVANQWNPRLSGVDIFSGMHFHRLPRSLSLSLFAQPHSNLMVHITKLTHIALPLGSPISPLALSTATLAPPPFTSTLRLSAPNPAMMTSSAPSL